VAGGEGVCSTGSQPFGPIFSLAKFTLALGKVRDKERELAMDVQRWKILGITLMVLGVGLMVYNVFPSYCGYGSFRYYCWEADALKALALGAMLIVGGIFAYKEGARK
jgi:hypothetical protein